MKQTRLGSTRIITSVEPGVIALTYTDRWSAFDRGSSPQTILGIGAARCACAVKSFHVAESAGVPTHFIEQISDICIHVKEFMVPGRKPLSGRVHGDVLPLEWIWRAEAADSLIARLAAGELMPEELGFPPGTVVAEGMRLPRMRLECTTKFEQIDRHLSNAEAMELAHLGEGEWDDIWYLIERANTQVGAVYRLAGFRRPDGKLEVGMTRGHEAVLVDVFGTPDEDRIIDIATGEPYSKDIIRNYLKALPWKKKLDQAKKDYPGDKSKWPPYPRLPAEIVDLVSTRYAEVAARYAGVRV